MNVLTMVGAPSKAPRPNNTFTADQTASCRVSAAHSKAGTSWNGGCSCGISNRTNYRALPSCGAEYGSIHRRDPDCCGADPRCRHPAQTRPAGTTNHRCDGDSHGGAIWIRGARVGIADCRSHGCSARDSGAGDCGTTCWSASHFSDG